ncbi:helicase HerA domain-containing protein [Haloarchaeobius amylolyticus]|uniref:Helicase HerA domain-containing protein n=1 Tax=Haloarchaeobius amylolyticus TaxID=1198296 RepID=A0ABD6BGZ9_9EURY
MSDEARQRQIRVGETADGADLKLPVIEVLTGRGFATGKSGSGKSNTASVIAEELLEAGYPLLIVDTDGEYYGLKEEYEMLHAGADEECDIQIGPEHAEQMATIALEENVPVILDVSGYLDEDVADELLREVARNLFVKEKKLKKPFLLVVEEVHEYIPEGGGVGETGNLLIKISKRGRKHGLGILGISQRPADVKKDFITQANWLVWHRLTWDNDTKVVGRIIDTEYAELVSELDDGQAFVQTDWTETDVRKIQFRRKRTFDAGATPGLDDFERPELKSVSDALVGDLQEISERKDRKQDRIQELEAELEKKKTRIETLEDELSSARDVSSAAKQMADALQNTETVQSQLPGGSEDLRRLHEEIADLEAERDDLREQLEARDDRIETLEDELRRLQDENERLREAATEQETADETGTDEGSTILQAGGDDLEFGYTPVDWDAATASIADTDTEDDAATPARDESARPPTDGRDLETVLATTAVGDRVDRACEGSQCSRETAHEVLRALDEHGALAAAALTAEVERSRVAVQGLLSELRTEGVLERTEDRRYALSDDVHR